jgi:hypothetical protein
MEVLSLPGGPGIGDTQSYQGPLTALSGAPHRSSLFNELPKPSLLCAKTVLGLVAVLRLLLVLRDDTCANARWETENRARFAESSWPSRKPQL